MAYAPPERPIRFEAYTDPSDRPAPTRSGYSTTRVAAPITTEHHLGRVPGASIVGFFTTQTAKTEIVEPEAGELGARGVMRTRIINEPQRVVRDTVVSAVQDKAAFAVYRATGLAPNQLADMNARLMQRMDGARRAAATTAINPRAAMAAFAGALTRMLSETLAITGTVAIALQLTGDRLRVSVPGLDGKPRHLDLDMRGQDPQAVAKQLVDVAKKVGADLRKITLDLSHLEDGDAQARIAAVEFWKGLKARGLEDRQILGRNGRPFDPGPEARFAAWMERKDAGRSLEQAVERHMNTLESRAGEKVDPTTARDYGYEP